MRLGIGLGRESTWHWLMRWSSCLGGRRQVRAGEGEAGSRAGGHAAVLCLISPRAAAPADSIANISIMFGGVGGQGGGSPSCVG